MCALKYHVLCSLWTFYSYRRTKCYLCYDFAHMAYVLLGKMFIHCGPNYVKSCFSVILNIDNDNHNDSLFHAMGLHELNSLVVVHFSEYDDTSVVSRVDKMFKHSLLTKFIS